MLPFRRVALPLKHCVCSISVASQPRSQYASRNGTFSKLQTLSHFHQTTDASTVVTEAIEAEPEPVVELTEDASVLSDLQEYAEKELDNIVNAKWFSLPTRDTTGEEAATAEIRDSLMTLTDAGDTYTYLRPEDFFYSHFLPVRSTQFLLDWMSDHWPYWVCVLAIPFLTKLCLTIPIISKVQRKHESIMPQIPIALQDFYVIQKKHKKDKQQWNRESAKLYNKYGFNPYAQNWRQFVAAGVTVPIHLTLFVATRTMYPAYPEWKIGGAAWFTDLSLPDPYYGLPIFCGAAMFSSILAFSRKAQKSLPWIPPEAMLTIGGVMSVLFIPMAAYFSAGFNLYLGSNMLSYLMQTMVLENDDVRAKIGLKPQSFTQYHTAEIARVSKELKEDHFGIQKDKAKATMAEIKGRRSKGRRVIRKE